MQFGPQRHDGPAPRGLEGWLPPLVVAVTSVLVAVALIYFIFVANNMRDRIPLPPTTIPVAMAAAGLLSLYMLLRAVQHARQVWRALREKDPGES